MTRLDESNSSQPASLQVPDMNASEERVDSCQAVITSSVLGRRGGTAVGSGPSRVTYTYIECMLTRGTLT